MIDTSQYNATRYHPTRDSIVRLFVGANKPHNVLPQIKRSDKKKRHRKKVLYPSVCEALPGPKHWTNWTTRLTRRTVVAVACLTFVDSLTAKSRILIFFLGYATSTNTFGLALGSSYKSIRSGEPILIGENINYYFTLSRINNSQSFNRYSAKFGFFPDLNLLNRKPPA